MSPTLEKPRVKFRKVPGMEADGAALDAPCGLWICNYQWSFDVRRKCLGFFFPTSRSSAVVRLTAACLRSRMCQKEGQRSPSEETSASTRLSRRLRAKPVVPAQTWRCSRLCRILICCTASPVCHMFALKSWTQRDQRRKTLWRTQTTQAQLKSSQLKLLLSLKSLDLKDFFKKIKSQFYKQDCWGSLEVNVVMKY